MRSITAALRQNRRVLGLGVIGCTFQSNGSFEELLDGVPWIECLYIEDVEGSVPTLAAKLPEMRDLRHINLAWQPAIMNESIPAFMAGLRQNTSLFDIEIIGDFPDEFTQQLRYYEQRNRYLSMSVVESANIPPSVWCRAIPHFSQQDGGGGVAFLIFRERLQSLLEERDRRASRRRDRAEAGLE